RSNPPSLVQRHPTPRHRPLPYTTLFRSRAMRNVVNRERAAEALPEDEEGAWVDVRPGKERSHRGVDVLLRAGDRGRSARPAVAADRKSTRLNSSHGSISYAVFCLKIKNE